MEIKRDPMKDIDQNIVGPPERWKPLTDDERQQIVRGIGYSWFTGRLLNAEAYWMNQTAVCMELALRSANVAYRRAAARLEEMAELDEKVMKVMQEQGENAQLWLAASRSAETHREAAAEIRKMITDGE